MSWLPVKKEGESTPWGLSTFERGWGFTLKAPVSRAYINHHYDDVYTGPGVWVCRRAFYVRWRWYRRGTWPTFNVRVLPFGIRRLPEGAA
jgi:hypothetical protein